MSGPTPSRCSRRRCEHPGQTLPPAGTAGNDGAVNSDADPTDSTDASGIRPLSGVVVLDLTRVLSGPHCGRMLTDLGAEVIKVEPPSGDLTRFSTPRRNGVASYFAQQNTGKRNLSLDLSMAEGAEILRDLSADRRRARRELPPRGDGQARPRRRRSLLRQPPIDLRVVVRVRPEWPLGASPCVRAGGRGRERNHRLPGQRSQRAYAKDPHSHADVYTAIEAASAVLAALYQRERTGRGQTIDVSMAETMMYVNEHLHDALWDGDDDPNWIRSFRPGDYIVMKTADGESLIVSGHPAERGTFDYFIAAMGRTDLADDERFRDVESRLAHYDELRDIIVSFAASVPDADTFEEIFAAHQLAVGRVRQPGELADTEWAVERGATVDVDDRSGGTIRLPNVPWRFGDAPGVAVSGVPKYRGEDNRAVLAEHLGYDDATLDRLEADGVVSSRMPS